jgi:hypothetical protein
MTELGIPGGLQRFSSRTAYDRDYQRPTWPGGASGVTVGIGYDLGYCTHDKLHADFDGRVSATMVRVMQRCLGVTGQAAKELLPTVRNYILIPWDVALAVFADRDVPEWTERVCKALPGADKLPPDCLGALVSIAYNRGTSFDKADDRYREMRDIKYQMMAGNLARIPDDIRSMKRLWPDMKGLRDRRDAEAKLFADGLACVAPKTVAPPDQSKVIPPAQSGRAARRNEAAGAASGTGSLHRRRRHRARRDRRGLGQTDRDCGGPSRCRPHRGVPRLQRMEREIAMFSLGLALGIALGAIGIGFLANRKPEWFAKVVKVANAVDDKAKDLASKA